MCALVALRKYLYFCSNEFCTFAESLIIAGERGIFRYVLSGLFAWWEGAMLSKQLEIKFATVLIKNRRPMKLSELRAFLDDKMSVDTFKALILPEVDEYQKRRLAKGGSIPITVINDAEMVASARDVSRVCEAYIQGGLNDTELAYISDALLLSNFAQDVAFLGKGLRDVLGQLTDPEINGPLDKEKVVDLLIKLSSEGQ